MIIYKCGNQNYNLYKSYNITINNILLRITIHFEIDYKNDCA